jgi:hypothetical protein
MEARAIRIASAHTLSANRRVPDPVFQLAYLTSWPRPELYFPGRRADAALRWAWTLDQRHIGFVAPHVRRMTLSLRRLQISLVGHAPVI